ncbi:LacI family DNA-binding transcriptional regulator [Brevundimonas balnearis]|uniref:LacI family DNA-binding transcriptional regulator n=1 Tax=Brevundimonas balnearis TaxID=1572858 RepID=A0ABV6R392_9CAUL
MRQSKGAQGVDGASAKAPTIRDVARVAGVSVASVSRVLNGLGPVTEHTRRKVFDAAAELRYVPHSGARSLSTSRTDTVGVILPDLFGEFFSELIRGLDVAARERGLHLLVSSSHDHADDAAAAVRNLRGRVDGLIVMSPHLASANLAASLVGNLPTLTLNGALDDETQPSIVVDNHGGAAEATRHLIAGGRRSIAHIAGPAGNLEAEARLAGYLEAMADAGLPSRVIDGDFDQASGHRAGRVLASEAERPDAVFAGNDMMAVGALLAFREAGLRCPQDVALCGFDDVPIAALVSPGLTTMRISIADVGRRALGRLADRIGGAATGQQPMREIVRPQLVARESSLSAGDIGATASRAADPVSQGGAR